MWYLLVFRPYGLCRTIRTLGLVAAGLSRQMFAEEWRREAAATSVPPSFDFRVLIFGP